MAVMQMNIFILTQYTPVRSSDLESFDRCTCNITSLGMSDSESVLIMYHEKLSFWIKLFLIHAVEETCFEKSLFVIGGKFWC